MRFVAAMILGLLVAGTAIGQGSRPPPSPQAVAVVEAIGAANLIRWSVTRYLQGFRMRLDDANPGKERVIAQSLARAEPKFQPLIDSNANRDQLASYFQERFSAAELEQLRQFFGSPAGRKFAQSLPALSQAFDVHTAVLLGNTNTGRAVLNDALSEMRSNGVVLPNERPR